MPVIRINEENYNLLQAKAKAEERPISWVLGRILTEHLKQKKKKSVHPHFNTMKDIFFEYWLKHNGTQFIDWDGGHSMALNRLIAKIEQTDKSNKPVEFFTVLMDNLSDFYKSKYIAAINKNYESIIADIKNRRNKGSKVQDGGQYDFRN